MKDITKLYLTQQSFIPVKASSAMCPAKGMYFWWGDDEAVEKLGILPLDELYYMTEKSKKYHLCYIGIGPMNETSKQPLPKRVFTWHLGKRIYASTLRYSIASLLGFQFYVKKKTKGYAYSVSSQDEASISNLLENNFIISIVSHNSPWDIEIAHIKKFRPPLNIDHNEAGWFLDEIVGSRAESRKNAIPL